MMFKMDAGAGKIIKSTDYRGSFRKKIHGDDYFPLIPFQVTKSIKAMNSPALETVIINLRYMCYQETLISEMYFRSSQKQPSYYIKFVFLHLSANCVRHGSNQRL
jgi:hypothetical protein